MSDGYSDETHAYLEGFLFGDKGIFDDLEKVKSTGGDLVGSVILLKGDKDIPEGEYIIMDETPEEYCAMPAHKVGYEVALFMLKKGHKVAREGWKDMYLKMVKSSDYMILLSSVNDISMLPLLPWIGLKTTDNKFIPWTSSQADMLAEDWGYVDVKGGE